MRCILVLAALVAAFAAALVLTSCTDRGGQGAGVARGVPAVNRPATTVPSRANGPGGTGRPLRFCFRHPSACGYPDPTTTGVPPNLTLTPVAQAKLPPGSTWNPATHELTVTGPGTVLTGLAVTGTVVIRAPRVTVANTRIIAPPDGFGVAIPIDSPAHDTKLIRLSIGAQPGQVSTAAVNNRGSSRLTISTVDFHGCTECFQNQARGGGTTLIRDSYLRSSDATPTCDADCPHYEVIYSSGNPGPMVLEHNTMLNPVDQTAVVFIDHGRHDDLRITENLIAGGGYTIYGGVHSRRQAITRNRFSTAFRRVGQDTYSRGPWPIPKVCVPQRSSGCFGNLTFAPPASELTWKGNFWDDTLRPVGY